MAVIADGGPHRPEQLFATDMRTERLSGGRRHPPQMLTMPAVGPVLAEHVRGLSHGVIQLDGEGDRIFLLLYDDDRHGGSVGIGALAALPVWLARRLAQDLVDACALVERGVDLADFAPPDTRTGERG